ncbi:MAG: YeeE/YedE family protein [Chloroflexi bacterium]|nr:YeeE/YedE family protein [Chloroflexota bacterium]
MTLFPLTLADYLGHWGAYVVFLFIGIAFGVVLEIAGFGKSTKLAAQFYFKEWTVLKVMFTAIVVAMVLIFLSTSIGLLDYNLVYVNPTYLLPGIVGGLIMGIGFIVGGFCPGTSLVAAATAKLDGIAFVLGAFFGIFLFGETVEYFEEFWYSTDMGRYTLQDMFGVDAGIVVLAVVLFALFAFWIGEHAEEYFGDFRRASFPRWRYAAAAVLILVAVAVLVLQQPSTQDKWNWIEDEQGERLTNREVQIHPAELLDTMHDNRINAILIDVRDESDYNAFHILDAVHIAPEDINDHIAQFREEPSNTVFVVMSNEEVLATEVWKTLVAESVINVYILEGGVNNWLSIYAEADFKAEYAPVSHASDEFGYALTSALGARHPAARPNPDVFEIEYEPKVKLQDKRGASGGGCG